MNYPLHGLAANPADPSSRFDRPGWVRYAPRPGERSSSSRARAREAGATQPSHGLPAQEARGE